jgi:hypothetical protein
MDEGAITGPVEDGAGGEEIEVGLRDGECGLGMDLLDRAITGIGNAVGAQGVGPPKAGMQPGKLGPQAGFGVPGVNQEASEHPVMVALEDDPVRPTRDPCDEKVEDTPAVRATVDKVADMDHRARAVQGDVVGDQVMRGLEEVEMPVDIADGVKVHVSALMADPGGFHTLRDPLVA